MTAAEHRSIAYDAEKALDWLTASEHWQKAADALPKATSGIYKNDFDKLCQRSKNCRHTYETQAA